MAVIEGVDSMDRAGMRWDDRFEAALNPMPTDSGIRVFAECFGDRLVDRLLG